MNEFCFEDGKVPFIPIGCAFASLLTRVTHMNGTQNSRTRQELNAKQNTNVRLVYLTLNLQWFKELHILEIWTLTAGTVPMYPRPKKPCCPQSWIEKDKGYKKRQGRMEKKMEGKQKGESNQVSRSDTATQIPLHYSEL